MTEQEAIKQLQFDMDMITFNPNTGEDISLEVLKLRNEENYKTYLADDVAIKALEEVQQYRAIGTVEECRATVEKRDKIYEQIETKILGKVCIGCGYLRDNICTYKGSNCGVSKPMYEDIKQVFEELKGGGVNE